MYDKLLYNDLAQMAARGTPDSPGRKESPNRPASPKPEKGLKKLPRNVRFSIWYFLLAIFVISLIQDFIIARRTETIPYGQFKQYLRQGRVGNLTIAADFIKGDLLPGKDQKDKQEFIAIRVEDPNLINELDAKNITYTGTYESKLLSALIAWVVPLGFFALIWWFFFRRMTPGASVMSFGKSKAKIVAQDIAKITFKDVAGVDEAKDELNEIISFLTNPAKYVHIGGRIPRGVLLVGAPGTGKTLLAKAVAGEAQVPFFSMSGSAFVEMFVGVGAARVRDLFEQAQTNAPCIVFIDELDALGKARVFGSMGGTEEREQTLNQLLVEMDGFDPNAGVIIMAATNRPEILDPALLRPGRFDRHILVDRPDVKGREEILKVHARNVKLAQGVDLAVIAARTPGFVGADLANVVNEAALLAARENKKEVEMSNLEEAIDRGMAGLQKKNRVITKKEKEIVAYHEAGHAVVASTVSMTDHVHKISIIPRGIAALGYTVQLPTEDRYLMTRTELLDKICVLLGGRMAEEMVFSEISTGGQNDLQRATEIANSMVKEYGMSDLGNVTFEKNSRSFFMPNMPHPASKDYSEETARKIDQEIQRIIGDMSIRVRGIIEQKNNILRQLAQLLLEKEVLEGDELKNILAQSQP